MREPRPLITRELDSSCAVHQVKLLISFPKLQVISSFRTKLQTKKLIPDEERAIFETATASPGRCLSHASLSCQPAPWPDVQQVPLTAKFLLSNISLFCKFLLSFSSWKKVFIKYNCSQLPDINPFIETYELTSDPFIKYISMTMQPDVPTFIKTTS